MMSLDVSCVPDGPNNNLSSLKCQSEALLEKGPNFLKFFGKTHERIWTESLRAHLQYDFSSQPFQAAFHIHFRFELCSSSADQATLGLLSNG